jgi:pyruvate-ferredoxin/flavodoxin oxidoreductase
MKAVVEAESYDGPSIILAYSPCINHGIIRGMGRSQDEEKLAVQSGYWPLYRYNPLLKLEGKNPFVLDSKEPKGNLKEFLGGEVRYAALEKLFPEEAAKLHTQLEKECAERYVLLKQKAEQELPVIETTEGAAVGDGDSDVCTLSSTAEHGGDEPCDDGRAGKG